MKAATCEDRPTILVLADHYLPGYKAGGPIRTLANLVEGLGDDFDIRIVTRDRDAGSTAPYPTVKSDAWNQVGKACVFYASPRGMGPLVLGHLLRDTRHDLLYLNSFFSPRLTVLPLLLRWLGRMPRLPAVIAPRGEFAPAALALKPKRKAMFRRLAAIVGLYGDLVWQATHANEKRQIEEAMGDVAVPICIVPNLAIGAAQPATRGRLPHSRQPGPLRLVFVSRLAPMKNLDFLIERLTEVRLPVVCEVHGPIGDTAYWDACRAAAQRFPGHIYFEYRGERPPSEVGEAFAAGDLFVFPTRGENFGHVIIEALAAGTPVMISDRTPWVSDPSGAVTVLPLENPEEWVQAIESWARMTEAELLARRKAALDYAERVWSSADAIAITRDMFRSALAEPATMQQPALRSRDHDQTPPAMQ